MRRVINTLLLCLTILVIGCTDNKDNNENKTSEYGIVSFSFLSKDNPQLLEDINGIIYEDIIVINSSSISDLTNLIPSISSIGKLSLNGTAFEPGKQYNFSDPVSLYSSNETGGGASYIKL